MDEIIAERARELGRYLSQTPEYSAVERSRAAVDDDRELVTHLNRLLELEQEAAGLVRRGEEPSDEFRSEYERVYSAIQSSAVYQGMVAAQSNFDKILMRVNEEITRGMEAGAKSRIILPS